jgi:tetratricopeptide (TPR) repeat protein
MIGCAYQFIGDQAAAQFFGERAMAGAAEPGTLIPNFFGFDHRIYTLLSLARALWLRGFPDQARKRAKTAIDESLSRVNPLFVCVTLTYGSPVFLWSGDFRRADDYAEQLIEYAGRYSLETYRAAGLGLKGELAIARGQVEIGINLLRGALETVSVLRANNLFISFIGALAEGLRKRGQVEEALVTINQAIGRATDCGSTFEMAGLLRVKAQVLAAMPQYGRVAAMNCLNEALAVSDIARLQEKAPSERVRASPFHFFTAYNVTSPRSPVIVDERRSSTSHDRKAVFLWQDPLTHRTAGSRRWSPPMSKQPTASILRGYSLLSRTTLSSTTSCATTGGSQRSENGQRATSSAKA